MMKAAQVTGGTNNNGTPGGHSGLLGANANLPSSSPGPQGQNMMPGTDALISIWKLPFSLTIAERWSNGKRFDVSNSH